MIILEDHSPTCRINGNLKVSLAARWCCPVVKDSGVSVWMMCNDPECRAVVSIRENQLSGWIEEELELTKFESAKREVVPV